MRLSAATSTGCGTARHGTRGVLPSTARRPPRAQWRRAAAACGKLSCSVARMLYCVAKMVYCGCKDGVRYLLGDGGEGDRPRQPDLPRRAVRAHTHAHAHKRAPAVINRRLPPTHFAATVAVGLLCEANAKPRLPSAAAVRHWATHYITGTACSASATGRTRSRATRTSTRSRAKSAHL